MSRKYPFPEHYNDEEVFKILIKIKENEIDIYEAYELIENRLL
jgi:hypothetical protein